MTALRTENNFLRFDRGISNADESDKSAVGFLSFSGKNFKVFVTCCSLKFELCDKLEPLQIHPVSLVNLGSFKIVNRQA